MPIPFAPLLGFALGGILAWVAGPELVRDDGPIVASRPFAVVTAFAALVWLPVVGYFVAFHGDFGTEPIGASALGKGVVLMTVVLVLAVAWTVRALLRMAAEARS